MTKRKASALTRPADEELATIVRGLFGATLKCGVEQLYLLGVPADVREKWIINTTLAVGERLGIPTAGMEEAMRSENDETV